MPAMKESEVTVEYQYTEAEYLAANRLLFFSHPHLFVRLIVFGLLLLVAAMMLSVVVTDLFPLWAIIAFVMLLEGGLFYNLLVRMPRTYFRGDGKFRDKYEITFSDEAIMVKTSQIDSKLAWSLYTRVLEGPDMYLLIYGKDVRMMTAVPKRAFKNSDQENQFRELVARHIADHKGLKQISPPENEYRPTSFTPPDWR
jgi:hypothetical protein